MSRSFAGEMKRRCQRTLKPQITVPVLGSSLCSTGWLPPSFLRCKHCVPYHLVQSPAKQRPGQQPRRREMMDRSPPLSPPPPPPTPARQHAGEVKGVSLNSPAPHAVPGDCSFPGLPQPLPAAGRARCAALCVWSCLSCAPAAASS